MPSFSEDTAFPCGLKLPAEDGEGPATEVIRMFEDEIADQLQTGLQGPLKQKFWAALCDCTVDILMAPEAPAAVRERDTVFPCAAAAISTKRLVPLLVVLQLITVHAANIDIYRQA